MVKNTMVRIKGRAAFDGHARADIGPDDLARRRQWRPQILSKGLK